MIKLFKKDSKGKIRTLEIKAEGHEVIQTSGLLDGKKVERRSNCVGKNIGRSNETTPQEQAVLEALSKAQKKQDEGYFETLEEAINEEVILPMLAKSYGPESRKIDWGSVKSGKELVFVQPKLDGMRAIRKNFDMMSRKGKDINTMAHITNELTGCSDWLDGELYAHGKSFQENMSMIKKYRPGISEAVKHHVYDIILPLPFVDRIRILYSVVADMENTVIVPTFRIYSEAELKEYHSRFISEGYEGTMVRWGDEGYKVNGRSSNLLKYKDFFDLAITIIDVEPQESTPEHGTPVFFWEGAKDNELRAGCKMSHAEREDLLTNKDKYIGKTAELRFFEYSDTGVPRFPVMVGIRLDK